MLWPIVLCCNKPCLVDSPTYVFFTMAIEIENILHTYVDLGWFCYNVEFIL